MFFGPNISVGRGFAVSGGPPAYDPDAQAFFDRVTAAGGTTSLTEKTATNQLVLDLKAATIWASILAIYPMVGASAAACGQNLKNSSFTGTFFGGWTFASTGATPNGLNTYIDTFLIPSTSLTVNSTHASIYLNTNNVPNNGDYDLGVYNSGAQFYLRQSSLTLASSNLAAEISTTQPTRQGFGITSKTSATLTKIYKNGISVASGNSGGALPPTKFLIATINYFGIPYSAGHTNNRIAFASIGDGLTDAQAGNFYTAVQTFQTILSRQV